MINKTKRSPASYAGELLFICVTAVAMIPIYYLVISTFKGQADSTNFPLALPTEWHFEGYAKAWVNMDYPRAFMNTLIITAFSLAGSIFVSCMAAYGFARRRKGVYTVLFYIILAGMMIPAQMSILAVFKLMRSLNLMNNIFSVVLLNIASGLPMSIFFVRNFILGSVPAEIEQAALVDGCSVFRTFFSVTLPLLKPVIATLAVMNSIGIWNDFLTPLMFLQSKDNRTIMLAVSSNIGQFSVNWAEMFPMLMLGVLPLIIFYLLMQRNIIKGIASGAVKG